MSPDLEVLSPENTTVVLVDYAVGFANLIRSHEVAEHINNVLGLAKTALLYETGLVVTNGLSSRPSGPLYPELLELLDDQPVIERPTAFDAFLDEQFAKAVQATGRRKLAIGGISTEGCVLQTVLGALRAGYEQYVVVDATASLSREAHETALQRMVHAGAVPVTWFSLAAEFQLDPRFAASQNRLRLMQDHVPAMNMGTRSYIAGQQHGQLAVMP